MARLLTIAKLLIRNRGADTEFWYWLKPGRNPTQREADKFLLGAILDYQILARVAWENARRLSEDILGDPPCLWHTITSVSVSQWRAKRQEYGLHRVPKAHERVWTIGQRIVQLYRGDARRIWQGQSLDEALCRLSALGVGEQISRMVAGALHDTGQVEGKGDVKADIHVRRVLGRVIQGASYRPQDSEMVTGLTREMHPEDPWQLDRPLYLLGKRICRAHEPDCGACYLQRECEYRKQNLS